MKVELQVFSKNKTNKQTTIGLIQKTKGKKREIGEDESNFSDTISVSLAKY